MADLPSTARAVIIGGGAVGASSLYHLALKGWTDCLLLEKNELTSGSTWHAAGNVPTFSASWSVMHMQRYSAALYRALGERVDYPMNYHVTGSLRLAHSRNRMMEFERVVGMGRSQGLDVSMVSVGDLKERYPFLETHDLAGGLYDPHDGDIDPAQLTQALAKGARDLGAKIVRFCPVTGVRRGAGEWIVETPRGAVRCEVVVNAAGYRAQEVGALFGRFVPMVSMSHQYMLTDPIPALEAWSAAHGGKLPLLRDVDSSYYLRQEGFGLNLGPYERNCRAHWTTPDDPMPEEFSFQLYPDDLDRLEWYVEDAMARVPILGTAGVNKVINGPIPYTPDGNPLIGPMPGAANAFEACVFTFGIAQAGGAGKVLAEWVADGGTEWDMWSCDPRRFTAYADQDHANRKGMEVYGHEYAMHFPHHTWPAGRDKRLSPIHDRLKRRGGQFGVYGGWERANWFARPGDDTSEAATRTWERDGPWFARIREECEAVRDAAGILNLCGFSRYLVSGAGAADWLEGLIAGRVPRVGRIGLGYFPDERGRIVTEMSLVRLAEDSVLLITAAAAEWHDLEWLRRHLPDRPDIAVENRTEEFDCQSLTGPKSPENPVRPVRRGPGPALAELAADRDRGQGRAAVARILRRRAGMGASCGGRGLGRRVRRGAGGRPPSRPEAVRHVRAEQPAAGKGIPGLERGPVDRLHRPGRRARPLRALEQGRLRRQGGNGDRAPGRAGQALRHAGRRCRRLRCALHVDPAPWRGDGRRDDLGRLGPPDRQVDRARHGAGRSGGRGHGTGCRNLRRAAPRRGAGRPAALRSGQRPDERT